MALKERLEEAVREEGFDPLTSEKLDGEAGTAESNDNSQQQGEENAEENSIDPSEPGNLGGNSEGSGDDTTKEEADTASSGQESDEEQPSTEDIQLEGKKGVTEVPVSYLKKLKEQAKAAKEPSEAQELKEQIRLLQEQLAQNQPPPSSAPDNPYDSELEPELHQMWQDKQEMRKEIDELKPQIQQVATSSQFSAAQNALNTIDREYEKANPGFLERKEQLIQQDVDSAALLQPGVSETELRAQVEQNILLNASNLSNQGMNPAEVLDAIAKQRGINTEKTKKPIPDIKKIEENKEKAKSLSGGEQPTMNDGLPTAEEFMSMDTEAVRKLQKKLGKKKFDAYIKGISGS